MFLPRVISGVYSGWGDGGRSCIKSNLRVIRVSLANHCLRLPFSLIELNLSRLAINLPSILITTHVRDKGFLISHDIIL